MPRCVGCDCAEPAPQGAPDFAIVAHGQPGDPGALQPEIEALADSIAPSRIVVGDRGDQGRRIAEVATKLFG